MGAAIAVAVLAGVCASAVAPAASAANPVITVTTTADIVNGSDGVLSLREAVAEANADSGADAIQLASGATYDLTLCGDDSSGPDNSVGDLDATDAGSVSIQGPATIHQTCPARLVESTAGPLILGSLTLTGGRSTSGAAVHAGGPLTLHGCSVTGNSVGTTSESDDGAVAAFGAPVSITDSSISDNAAAGLFKSAVPGVTAADLQVTSSWVSRNEVDGARAAGIIALYGVTLESSHVTDNLNHSSASSAAGGIASLDAQITLSEVSGNHGPVGGISGGFHLSDSTLVRNVGGFLAGGGRGVFDIVRSTVSDNSTTFLGGGLEGGGTITDSAVTNNVAYDTAQGRAGTGGGIVVDGDGSLVVRNSTVTGNRGQLSAGILGVDYPAGHPSSVQLIASTVAGNVNTPYPGLPQASDLAFATPDGLPTTEPPGTLSVEASVLGDNTQAVPACVLQTATVTSTGYDFDADDSCGIGGGVGDIVSGGDPMLAPLASQSAFTDVRVQLRGSPLTDVIPSGAPQCQTRDQNWRDRPAGSGCDIGASETSGFPSGGGPIVPVAPERIVDTRVGTGGLTPLGATAQSLVVAGTHGIPADATAVVLDITGTDVLTPTFITAYPGGSGPGPNASTLNLATGQTAANMAVVKLGAGGAVRFANAHGTVNLVVDVVGYVLPESSNVESMYETTPPTRLADSRDHTVLTTFAPHSTQSLVVAGGASPVPAAATAVMVNITATDVSSPSFITAYPKGISRPTASNLNIDRHETRAVAALVKVGADRSIALFNDSGTLDLVVDVVGYVGGDNRYVGLPPRRLIDTRASGHIGPLHPFGPDEHQPFAVVGDAIPDQVKAVVLNVTVTDSVTGTFVTAYPTPTGPDLGPPNVSNVNVGPDQTNPNLVVVEVGAGGKISLYNKLGSANVVVDLVGYFW